MRGLLVKDFYMIRSVVIMMTGVFLVIGAGLSYLVSPQVLLTILSPETGNAALKRVHPHALSILMVDASTIPVITVARISST